MAKPAERDGASRPETIAQLTELTRMRLFSTGLLVFMAALFALSSVYGTLWPGLAFIRAFSEAAVVGACADWFAVVALFRHPLGLPIPHTAIIPRQKLRIGEAFGRFVSRNFLAPAEIALRLERVDAAAWLANWLKNDDNVALVAERIQDLGQPLLDILSEEQISSFGRSTILNGIDSIALAPLAARGASVLLSQGYFTAIFDRGVDILRTFLQQHRENIRERVAKNATRWIPGRIDARLSDAILDEILSTLAAARENPSHPWRVRCRAMLDQWIIKLAEDPLLFERFELFKSKFLDRSVVQDYLNWLGEEMEEKVRHELTARDGVIASSLRRVVQSAEHWLHDDDEIRSLINDGARRFALNAINFSRDEIGAFVANVVARWDTETLVNRVELQVGRDLQFIRVNGTIVGGLVGLIIYSLTNLIHN